MKGAFTPSVLVALVCGASAQVAVSLDSPGLELQPIPEGVRTPPDLALSDAGLREALSVHRNFDYGRRARIDLYLSESDRFQASPAPVPNDLNPPRATSDPIPVMASMVPGGVLAERAVAEAPAQPVVELELGDELAQMFGFWAETREAKVTLLGAPPRGSTPEPASVAALAIGFGGLIRARLRKAGRLGSRRRR